MCKEIEEKEADSMIMSAEKYNKEVFLIELEESLKEMKEKENQKKQHSLLGEIYLQQKRSRCGNLYDIEYTSNFKNQFKRLLKKYPRSEEEFRQVFEKLESGDLIGVAYNNLGLEENEDVYKVMVANIDANRSPKNGFRMIYYAIKNDRLIYMLAVYSKKEISNLKQHEVKDLIRKYCK